MSLTPRKKSLSSTRHIQQHRAAFALRPSAQSPFATGSYHLHDAFTVVTVGCLVQLPEMNETLFVSFRILLHFCFIFIFCLILSEKLLHSASFLFHSASFLFHSVSFQLHSSFCLFHSASIMFHFVSFLASQIFISFHLFHSFRAIFQWFKFL